MLTSVADVAFPCPQVYRQVETSIPAIRGTKDDCYENH